jgi:hypothetical protein
MTLTREFTHTVAACVQRDPRFCEALFTEALNAYFAGDTTVGKTILQDLVNDTIGFEEVAMTLKKPSKGNEHAWRDHYWERARSTAAVGPPWVSFHRRK